MKKRIFLVALMSLFAISFIACNGDSTESTTAAAPKDELTIVGQLVANELDPFVLGDSDRVVNFQIFDSLLRFGNDGQIEAGLAETWTEASDGLTLTFNLRHDVTFHDGSAFTADDVIYSIDTLLAVTMNSWMMSYITSYQKIDDYTVEVVKATPSSKITNIFADRLYIVPSDMYENDYDTFSINPIGTGAYEFVSQADDKSVTLVANTDYYLGQAAITNVTVLAPCDASAAVIKLETGEADIIFSVPAAQKAIITGNEDLQYNETPGWAMNTLLLMGDDMADLNLRKAIDFAVNPENAILVANEGIGSVPTNLFSEKTIGDLAGEVAVNGYDATQATSYLALSNYTSEMDLVISVDATGAPIAQSIQSDLSAIGITVTIEQLETNNLFAKLMNGELDMTILQMGTHMNGPEEMLSFPVMPPFSFGMTLEAARTTVINQILVETDSAARSLLCIEALEYAVAASDIIPVFEPVSNVAYSNQLANVQAIWAATGIFYLNEVTAA